MRRDPPPLAHGGNADYLAAELDYDEMLALSGLLRQWVIGDSMIGHHRAGWRKDPAPAATPYTRKQRRHWA